MTPKPPPNDEVLEAKHAAHSDACCYVLICEAVKIPEYAHMSGHIYFGEYPGRTISPEKLRLRFEIEDASYLLRDAVSPVDAIRYKEYFTQLLTIAQMGLLCEKANPAYAATDLEKLKQAIVKQQSKTVRGKHLNRLMWLTFGLAAVLTALAVWVSPMIAKAGLPIEQRHVPLIVNCLIMIAAAMVCTWLSFAITFSEIRFDELRDPQNDHLSPIQRVLCVALETLILALFGYKKLAGVFLGDFSTQRLGEDIGSALVFGIACGLSQRVLSQTIEPIVQSVISGMKKPAINQASQAAAERVDQRG